MVLKHEKCLFNLIILMQWMLKLASDMRKIIQSFTALLITHSLTSQFTAIHSDAIGFQM